VVGQDGEELEGRGEALEGRGAANAGAPDMGVGADTVDRGEIGDALGLGEAAAGAGVRLDDVHGAGLEDAAEVVAGEGALAAGDGDRGRGAEAKGSTIGASRGWARMAVIFMG
jgi:hypothetical protein